MTYFTSWDINVLLCLIYVGIPDDVIKRMIKTVKMTHEEFSLDEAKDYWDKNYPKLVRVDHPSRLKRLKFYVSNDNDRGRTRIQTWQNRCNNTREFKTEWRLRSIELRQAKVIEWCKFGERQDQQRHQRRLMIRNPSDSYSNDYTKNLWQSWEAWSHCENPPQIMSWDTVRPQPQDRRNYISKWYEGIHPGRFFLFYRKNKIIEERNKGVPKGPCDNGYQFPKMGIFDWGPYEQLIEDLRCIDGPGLCESGSKVEHIDDLFSQ